LASKDGIGCEDVFITANGDRSEKVIGWITNGKPRENAAFADDSGAFARSQPVRRRHSATRALDRTGTEL
jgi:hypothetical protein